MMENPFHENIIWKYELGIESALEIPKGAKFLSAEHQPTLGNRAWFQVDPTAERETRHFVILGTGKRFNPKGLLHLATFQDPPFVWHLFEVKK